VKFDRIWQIHLGGFILQIHLARLEMASEKIDLL